MDEKKPRTKVSWAAKTSGHSLSSRILSGYSNFQLDKSSTPDFVKKLLEPMRAAHFTACDLKVRPTNIDLKDPRQFNRLQELSHVIEARGLLFLVYVYPHPHHGRRNPVTHVNLPAFVRDDGTVVEDRFSLIHWPTWRQLFDNAFQLAHASTKLPIAAVRLDLETINNTGISYDDHAWGRFALQHDLDPHVPVHQRASLLQSRHLAQTYKQWFIRQLEAVAQRFQGEMHRINPDLMLGMMPAYDNWFFNAFIKHLATERAPAIIDNWTMYNGEGFGEAVLAERDRVKKLNPYNLSIPWFRINSYRPEDITVHAYHAAFATDGYSSWDMVMLYSSRDMVMLGDNYQKMDATYRLPRPHTPTDYYDAYRRANEQILADLKDGKTKPLGIPFKPITPLSPPLKLDDIKIPQLQPAGDGTGKPQWFVLRDRCVIYVHVQAGEDIKIDIRHLAGNRRPVALQYAVIDAQHHKLRHESIMPGAIESFTCTAPKAATYALVVTGGIGGQAWYGIRVHNQHIGVLAEQAHFFYAQPFDVWVSRTHPTKPARVKVGTGRNQIFTASFNNAETIQTNDIAFHLPLNHDTAILRLGKPAQMPQGLYTQDLLVSIEGAVEPYLADGPQRRLTATENYRGIEVMAKRLSQENSSLRSS